MTGPRPCYRHPREIWLAACSDCTAWHMAAVMARRDEVAAASAARATEQTGALRLVA